ncbi:flagellar export protein FliJ [Specibacter cremeus]|uniref:flagellar export protein FliJ n=1 Tax=Specibacter cremeus TaxID=1629051 RepID=UPI000F7AA7FE|nr:flagellar export protein FliJ [Specibacter cremeus]
MGNTFRLAGLLRFRQVQADEAAGVLARTNGRRRAHQDAIAAARDKLGTTPGEPGSAAALAAAAAARSAARHMLADLHALTDSLDDAARAAEADLVAAKTASSTLEKLADQHAAALLVEDLRAEQQVLDELSGTLYRAGTPGAGVGR